MEFSHFDESGNAWMVDVSGKADTSREAVAEGCIFMSPECFQKVREGSMKKGDVLGVARVAGIMGAKRTSELIPLCHILNLTKLAVDFELLPERNAVRAVCTAKTAGKTGRNCRIRRTCEAADEPYAACQVEGEPCQHRNEGGYAAFGADEEIDRLDNAPVRKLIPHDLAGAVLVGVRRLHVEAPVVDADAGERLVLYHLERALGKFHAGLARRLRRLHEALDDARQHDRKPDQGRKAEGDHPRELAERPAPFEQAQQGGKSVGHGNHRDRTAGVAPEGRDHRAREGDGANPPAPFRKANRSRCSTTAT